MIRIPTTVLATVWLVLVLAGQCRAADSGTELLKECQLLQRATTGSDSKLTSLELFQAGKCMGIVEGIMFTGKLLSEPLRFCSPEGVTMDQAVGVLLKFLNAKPQLARENGEALAGVAFHAAWPCK
jgi:Ssp1 endopeptidase immunity protein Rap1a